MFLSGLVCASLNPSYSFSPITGLCNEFLSSASLNVIILPSAYLLTLMGDNYSDVTYFDDSLF